MERYVAHLTKMVEQVERLYGIDKNASVRKITQFLASSTLAEDERKKLGNAVGVVLIPAAFLCYRIVYFGLHPVDFSSFKRAGVAEDLQRYVTPFTSASTVTQQAIAALNEVLRCLMKVEALDVEAMGWLSYRLVRCFIVAAFRSNWGNAGILANLITANNGGLR